MFFYLIKVTMWLLHVFLPIFSVLLHIPLLAIWAYGIHIQTSPDTIDPARINNGAPWYITKNCNIVEDANVQKYCMQAKSSFAVSCIMLYVPSQTTPSLPLNATSKLTISQLPLRPLPLPLPLLPLPLQTRPRRPPHPPGRKSSRKRKMERLHS
jgi:hypothetical protein